MKAEHVGGREKEKGEGLEGVYIRMHACTVERK